MHQGRVVMISNLIDYVVAFSISLLDAPLLNASVDCQGG